MVLRDASASKNYTGIPVAPATNMRYDNINFFYSQLVLNGVELVPILTVQYGIFSQKSTTQTERSEIS